jgi:hypothetical protein
MNDMTGIVASLLARSKAANAEDKVLLIPAGGEQKENEEMTVIDFLSQQVQIAVDSLKSAYPNNKNGLDAVKKFLDEIEAEDWGDYDDKDDLFSLAHGYPVEIHLARMFTSNLAPDEL